MIRVVDDDEQRVEAFRELCLPLASAVGADDAPPAVVEYGLTLLANAFRFGVRSRQTRPRGALADEPPDADDSLFGVLQSLWPLVSRILLDRVTDDVSLEAACRFLRYTSCALPAPQVSAAAAARRHVPVRN